MSEFRFEKIGNRREYGDRKGRPVYVVWKDDVELGVIEPATYHPVIKAKGRRYRTREGVPRPAFCRPSYYLPGHKYVPSGMARDTREDVAWELKRNPMPADVIAQFRERYAEKAAKTTESKEPS